MKKTKKQNKRKIVVLISILLIGILAYGYIKPIYQIQVMHTLQPLSSQSKNINWPDTTEAALSISDQSQILTNGPSTPIPTASTAKVVTALMVLKKYPLALNQQGPLITLGQNDVAIYDSYVQLDGSVVPVNNGEKISEYNALEAILIPSSCNMSDSLAIWAFGTLHNYIAFANKTLKEYGINNTLISSDASGFSPLSTSTPEDLVKIGKLALKDPVISKIVQEKTAIIPVAGLVKNYNTMIGQEGIIGIKTGNNDEDKGAFLFAAKNTIPGSNKQGITVGAVMGGPSLYAALKDSQGLIKDSLNNYSVNTFPKANQVVGYYKAPWSDQKFSITASSGNQYILWGNQEIKSSYSFKKINYLTKSGTNVGTIVTDSNQNNLILNQKISIPSIIWVIENLFKF